MFPKFAALVFFFFNDTATTEIYTLSLHDALPIFPGPGRRRGRQLGRCRVGRGPAVGYEPGAERAEDRKSTRLNSSHSQISYAVFCLKKKNNHDDLVNHFIHYRHYVADSYMSPIVS